MSLDYKDMSVELYIFDSYTQITLAEVEEKTKTLSHKLPPDAENVEFYLECEDRGEYGDTSYKIILNAKFKQKQTSMEVELAKQFNDRLENNYKKELELYELRLKDWEENVKINEQNLKNKEYEQYLVLKQKFENK